MTDQPTTAQLQRVRTATRSTLMLGIGASLAANMLAAHHSIPGRIIAAWSPVALLLTVELLSRVPVGASWQSALRVAAAGCIAGIAAWVSYWHMVEVALAYGEKTVAAHLLPISVDGLVVVAAVSLSEINGRLTQKPVRKPAPAKAAAPAPTLEPVKRLQDDVVPAPKTQVSASPDLRTAVRALAAEQPTWTQGQLAEHVGCSERSVRRHLSTPTLTAVPSAPTPLHPPKEAQA